MYSSELEITLDFIGVDINYNQHDFINSNSTLSTILKSIDIINEYLMKGDKVDIIIF